MHYGIFLHFHARKKKNDFNWCSSNVQVKLLPYLKDIKRDEEKQICIARCLMDEIQLLFLKYKIENKNQVLIVFEGYVFSIGKSFGNHKLHEITGLVRCEIYRAGFYNIKTVHPKTWQSFIGKKVTKQDTVLHIEKNGPCLNFITLLNLKQCKKKGKVLNPAEGLADACGIMLYVLHEFEENGDVTLGADNDADDEGTDDMDD